MRKFILALILLLAVILVISRFTEVEQIVTTLRRGDLRFVLLAIGVEVLFLVNMGASFKSVYGILGMHEKTIHMFRLAAAAAFVNVIAPVGGVSGLTVFISDARRRNLPIGKVTAASGIYLFFEYTGFLVVLTFGLAVLARRNNLHPTEIIASLILAGIALALGILLYMGMRSAELLGRTLAWLALRVNRILKPFIHRDYLSTDRAREFAWEVSEGIKALRSAPQTMLKPLALAISSKVLLMVVMMLAFLAFKVPFTVGTLVAGFSMAYLFLIVSPTPSGIGIVEGVLTLSLTSLLVPVEDATVVMLTYRGITFWFMLLVGSLAFRSLAGLRNLNKLEVN